jgi:hypothetical protein
MKMHGGVGVNSPSVKLPHWTEVSGQLYNPHSLPLYHKYSLDKALDGPQNQPGCGKEKNIPTTDGNRTLFIQSVARSSVRYLG